MEPIPVSTPSLNDHDIQAVAKTMAEGWISSEGPPVQEFEKAFAHLVQRRHGIAVANGTAALDIALEGLGIGPGDEVIIPSFTIISCLNQVLRSGATPVFVDAQRDTWNMDVSALKGLITPRTKAIIVVHIYGLPADIDQVVALAKEHDIAVIEDSAEAHGQQLDGAPLGSFGDVSTFSFYSNKLITTGEGGMVLTDDDRLEAKFRELRNLSFNPAQRFVHEDIGWNYRMTSMQAALGISQLSRIDELLDYKKKVGQTYQELLDGTPGISLPLPSYRGSENVYWIFGIVLDPDSPHTASEMMNKLAAKGIGTRPFFYPLHQQPVLSKFGFEPTPALPNAEWLGKQGFYVPNGAGLSRTQQEYIAHTVQEALVS